MSRNPGGQHGDSARPAGRRGSVCFVGLGPGDPALRTERASQRIASADHVFDGDVPTEALIERAKQGQHVARLVVGDPLESQVVVASVIAVASAGVAIEVVPGVSARAAASAFAGVLGPAVRVATNDVALAVHGEPREAVVTLIVQAGSPSQRVLVTLASKAAEGARALASTGVDDVIVAFGAPEDPLRWSEGRPLFGKRILVTRAREQAGGTAALLRDRGADPVVVPTIEIHPPPDPGPMGRALVALRAGAYTWVAFTSANGVDRTWDALTAAGGDARAFGRAKIAAIGPATARALEQRGLTADVVAKEFRGEALAEEMLGAMRPADADAARAVRSTDAGAMAPVARPRVLLARAAVARDVVPDALRQAGCVVDVVAAYETRPPEPRVVEALKEALGAGRLDAVTFTSSSTVDNLCDLLGRSAAGLLARVRVASIGPVTTATAESRGVRVDVTARVYTVPGLVDALLESYAQVPEPGS